MTKLRTTATAIVTTVGVVALCGAALAQTGGSGRSPSQSDFDACNREAQIGRGGSASPSTSSGGAAGGASSATGSATGSAGAGSAAGATGSTGSVSGGSTLSSGSASPTGDMSLPGIATSAQTDPAYQQAYRDCLRRRGF